VGVGCNDDGDDDADDGDDDDGDDHVGVGCQYCNVGEDHQRFIVIIITVIITIIIGVRVIITFTIVVIVVTIGPTSIITCVDINCSNQHVACGIMMMMMMVMVMVMMMMMMMLMLGEQDGTIRVFEISTGAVVSTMGNSNGG